MSSTIDGFGSALTDVASVSKSAEEANSNCIVRFVGVTNAKVKRK